MATQSKKIAIIGSGMLGSNWAMLFANAGYTVSIYDVEPGQLDKAFVAIRENFNMLAKNGLLLGDRTIDERIALISATSDLEHCLSGAFYVQECIPEDLALKQKVFARFDSSSSLEQAKMTVVLASSSSTMPISMITSLNKRRHQSIIVHPVNPVFYLRVVEVVPAPYTAPEITKIAREVMLSIGRAPVVCRREIAGFAVNRIQYALMSEAWHLVDDGILEPEEVDTVITEGLGPRYAFFGPWEITVLNAPKGTIDYCTRYSKPCQGVLDTFKAPATWDPEHPTTQKIAHAMEKRVPTDRIPDFRVLRDVYLQELCKIKTKHDKDEVISKWKTD